MRFFIFSLTFTIMVSLNQIPLNADSITLDENEVLYSFFSLPDGEALLITTGKDKKILINTGSKNSKKALSSQLKQMDVSTLDVLVLTGKSDDTCGNADFIIKKYNVSNVVANMTDTCVSNNKNVNLKVWESGKVYELSPGLMFRVMKVTDNNPMSLVIMFGNNDLLFMSEASEEMEALVKMFPSRIEMLKIPEYALKNYPSAELLEHINPHLAIIYNIHEKVLHAGVLERLSDSWIDIYHLKTLGTIHILCNPSDYEVKK